MDSLRSPAPPPPPPPPALPSPPAAVRGERLRALHWEPLSAARVRGRRSVWAPRTPPPALDLPRLRLLFREPRGASPGQRPPPVAALLEPKRSIALGVLLKQLKRPVRQIVRDIEEGVGAPYGAELLLELSRLLPGAVELRAAPGADGAAGGVLPATQRAPRLHPNPRRRRGGGGAVRGAARGSASRPERGEPPERGRLRGQRRRVSPGLAAEAARHQGQRAGRGPAALRGHGGGTDRPTPVGLPEQTAARGPGLADRRGGGGGGAAAAVGARGGGAGCGSGAVRGAAAVRAGGGGGAARGAGGEGTDVRSRGGSARLLLRGGGAGRAAGAVCGAARLRGPLPERRAGNAARPAFTPPLAAPLRPHAVSAQENRAREQSQRRRQQLELQRDKRRSVATCSLRDAEPDGSGRPLRNAPALLRRNTAPALPELRGDPGSPRPETFPSAPPPSAPPPPSRLAALFSRWGSRRAPPAPSGGPALLGFLRRLAGGAARGAPPS
ncbi:collagen alpha-2(I) chain-like isoform X7 [Gallus gallus]|uniref:collagen alpha-2(I) chain-like isoform X7 n=1 Tax=Gallus gallus TaxID=9031 RepID=UPI001AE758A9|nr:collagen alpha-2(I) chain-like isoform X7 [Gallus gallus]